MTITVTNLYKKFNDKNVLNNVNVVFHSGERYCLMGESGAGKTTFLRILSGLEKLYEGSIEGTNELRVSFMFQEDRLVEHISAIENVEIVLKGHGKYKNMSNKELKKVISDSLVDVLPQEAHLRPVKELSGGMKRRVALARALMYESDILLLDEPFTGLDEDNKKRAATFIEKYLGDRCLIFTTHDKEDEAMLKAMHIEI